MYLAYTCLYIKEKYFAKTNKTFCANISPQELLNFSVISTVLCYISNSKICFFFEVSNCSWHCILGILIGSLSYFEIAVSHCFSLLLLFLITLRKHFSMLFGISLSPQLVVTSNCCSRIITEATKRVGPEGRKLKQNHSYKLK